MTRRTDPNHARLTVETVGDGDTTRIILRGEADSTNLTDLEAALAGIALNGTKQVQLHVCDLTFVDIAALRELTLFARQLKEPGLEFRTYDAPPLLEQLARLVGVDDDLGVA